MRIWSVHPAHLDRIGLVACWRETLLAQSVLAGRTTGYRQHPQLARFRACAHPMRAVGAYLTGLAAEAARRGYRFDGSRIQQPTEPDGSIPVTTGQLAYEWTHLGRKLDTRSPEDAARWQSTAPTAHPLFRVVHGEIEPWERLHRDGTTA